MTISSVPMTRKKADRTAAQCEGNSIRCGDKWVNTAWLGPISVPSVEHSRKCSEGKADKAFQCSRECSWHSVTFPGLDLAGTIDGLLDPQARAPLSNKAAHIQPVRMPLTKRIAALIPSLFSDVAKAVDPMMERRSFSADGARSKAVSPGLDQSLPD